MYLPKALYEPLPYFYFALSLFILFQESHWAFSLSALLFYFAGSVVLVKRSEHRRKDKQRITLDHYKLPETLYEFLPFIYIAMGVVLVISFPAPMPQLVSAILFIIAIRNLVCRHMNRTKESDSKILHR